MNGVLKPVKMCNMGTCETRKKVLNYSKFNVGVACYEAKNI